MSILNPRMLFAKYFVYIFSYFDGTTFQVCYRIYRTVTLKLLFYAILNKIMLNLITRRQFWGSADILNLILTLNRFLLIHYQAYYRKIVEFLLSQAIILKNRTFSIPYLLRHFSLLFLVENPQKFCRSNRVASCTCV